MMLSAIAGTTSSVGTAVALMPPESAQHMVQHVPIATKRITGNRYAAKVAVAQQTPAEVRLQMPKFQKAWKIFLLPWTMTSVNSHQH